MLLLHIFYKPGHYKETSSFKVNLTNEYKKSKNTRLNKVLKNTLKKTKKPKKENLIFDETLNKKYLLNEEEEEKRINKKKLEELEFKKKSDSDNFFFNILNYSLNLIYYYPSLFYSGRKKSLGIDDKVHYHQKITTGLLEDLLSIILNFVDQFSKFLRFLVRCKIKKAIIELWNGIKLFNPLNIFSLEGVDTRKLGEIIQYQGYPYERYDVTTEDGYILSLDRIPNPESEHVVYFQHGIMDSGYTWVATDQCNFLKKN
jgi:hypothetical protein